MQSNSNVEGTLSGDESLVLPEFGAPPREPLALLRRWFADADARGVRETAAGTLSTADRQGRVSSRTVLLKELGDGGLIFTSHGGGLKGRQIEENPRAAMNFYWRESLQQVCIEGGVQRCSEAESDTFFAERPRSAQATTAVSRQGQALLHEDELAVRALELSQRPGQIARPAEWFGYLLVPDVVEFWHGRVNRLHSRLRFDRLTTDDPWTVRRIQP
jgi:pyridoxamine 5'-phosphate oxidase